MYPSVSGTKVLIEFRIVCIFSPIFEIALEGAASLAFEHWRVSGPPGEGKQQMAIQNTAVMFGDRCCFTSSAHSCTFQPPTAFVPIG
jgi:hypothetical protein